MKATAWRQTFGKTAVKFMEDAEDLVGVNGAEGEIVVGIASIVEVEAAQHAGVQQPRYNLLDVLRGVVMTGVDQHARLRAGLTSQMDDMPQSAISVW